MTLPHLGRTATSAGLAVVLVAGGATAVLISQPTLTRDTAFVVSTPRDGARVGADFLLRWAPSGQHSTYAVVVDADVPAPGAAVEASPRVLTVTGTALRLTLGRAKTGSPSARGFHTVTVVALDGSGRRVGTDAAVVHVRNGS